MLMMMQARGARVWLPFFFIIFRAVFLSEGVCPASAFRCPYLSLEAIEQRRQTMRLSGTEAARSSGRQLWCLETCNGFVRCSFLVCFESGFTL
jgi:hypothetical protein